METKKKAKKPLTDKNALVKELKEVEWIKNPFIYSQIRGDFSLLQTQIMLAVVSNLQDQINDYINNRGKSHQLTLPFTGDESEVKEGEVLFKIRLADLEIRKDKYRELDDACAKLLKMSVTYNKIEPDGKEYTVMANLFSRIEIPKNSRKSDDTEYKYQNKERREGTIKIFMLKNNVNDVFDMRKGYVEHVKKFIPLCRKRRTPRLYIYLSRWKEVGHKLVDYNELKEYLGVLTLDAKRQTVTADQYPMYYNFSSKVLDPVKEEMDALSTMNVIDFTFTYEPKYSNGKKRGNPDGILFNIILSELGQQKKSKLSLDKTSAASQQLLKEEYGLTDNDVYSLYADLSPEMIPSVNAEVYNLRERLQTIKMKSPKLYVLQSMRNYIESIRPVASEIIEPSADTQETKARKRATLSESDLRMWEGFLQLVKATVSQQDMDTYWNYVSCKSITDEGIVTLRVPSRFVAEHIDDEICTQLNVAFFSVFGEKTKLCYDVETL
jgi:hypothetical protein